MSKLFKSEREGLMPKALEDGIRHHVQEILENGRPGFDWPHTEHVVDYAKRLLPDYLTLDEKTFVTAAYYHDTGYSGMYEGGLATYDKTQDKKRLHMELGAQRVREELQTKFPDQYTDEEIEMIAGLVGIHDDVWSITEAFDALVESGVDLAGIEEGNQLFTLSAQVLMEADTLGAFRMGVESPTYGPEDLRRYANVSREKRLSRMRTPFAVEEGERLLDQIDANVEEVLSAEC